MNDETMLTTVDNPFNPFDDFDSWFMFDIEKGYNTCGRLMRLAVITEDMSDKEVSDEVDRAMNRLIQADPLDIFKKITCKTA